MMSLNSLAIDNIVRTEEFSTFPTPEDTMNCCCKMCEEHQAVMNISREETAIDLLLHILNVERSATITESNDNIRHFSLLDCSFCNGLLLDPRTLSCGHTYCYKCLQICRESNYGCKICDSRMETSEIQKNLSIGTILQKFNVTTQFDEHTLPISLLEDGTSGFQFSVIQEHVALLLRNDRTQEALDLLDRSRTCFIHRKRAVKYKLKGTIYLALENWLDAVINLATSLFNDPGNVHIRKLLREAMLHYLGMINRDGFNDNQAICSLEKIIAPVRKSVQNNVEKDEHISMATCLDCETQWKQLRESNISPTNGLQCAVCTRLHLQPVSLPCGHSFCCECLERSLDFKTVCPLCRASALQMASVKIKKSDSTLKQIIKELFNDSYTEREQSLLNDLQIFSRASSHDAEEVPIFVCSLALPTIQCMFHIFEPRYRYMLRKCMQTGSCQFGMCSYDEQKGFAMYGTMVEIQQWQLFEDGRSAISCTGGRRFKVLSRGFLDGFNTAKIKWIEDKHIEVGDVEDVNILSLQLYKSCQELFTSLPSYAQEHLKSALGPMPPFDEPCQNDGNGPAWVWWMMQFVVVDDTQRLRALSLNNLKQRLNLVSSCISNFL